MIELKLLLCLSLLSIDIIFILLRSWLHEPAVKQFVVDSTWIKVFSFTVPITNSFCLVSDLWNKQIGNEYVKKYEDIWIIWMNKRSSCHRGGIIIINMRILQLEIFKEAVKPSLRAWSWKKKETYQNASTFAFVREYIISGICCDWESMRIN